MLFLSSLRVCLENLLLYGNRVNPAGWLKFLFGEDFHFPVIYLLLFSLLGPISTLFLEKRLANENIEWKTCSILHMIILVVHLSIPIFMINLKCLDIGLISAVLACGIYTVIFLKMISYIQVNKWCRDIIMRRSMINRHMYGNGDFFLQERNTAKFKLAIDRTFRNKLNSLYEVNYISS